MLKRWVLVMTLLSGCAAPVSPRFANWDPVREDLPALVDRREALQRLETSRELWYHWQREQAPAWIDTGRPATSPGVYSYVRGQQIAASEARFTLFEVQQGRVVLRVLLSADPARLDVHEARPESRSLRAHWIERGAALGTHADAAPLLTVDQLYSGCRALFEQASATLPRLYFHPDGLLMQCGYPPSECADCPSYSLSSVAAFSTLRDMSSNDAADWLCETETGPVTPGTVFPFLPDHYRCYAPFRDQGKQEPPADSPADGICRLDPAACRSIAERPGAVYWTQARPGICSGWPEHTPSPLEVGKAEPLTEWSFPFGWVGGIECGRGSAQQRRIRPSLSPRRAQ